MVQSFESVISRKMPQLEKHPNMCAAAYAGGTSSLSLVFNIFFMLISFTMAVVLSNKIFSEFLEIFGLGNACLT